MPNVNIQCSILFYECFETLTFFNYQISTSGIYIKSDVKISFYIYTECQRLIHTYKLFLFSFILFVLLLTFLKFNLILTF